MQELSVKVDADCIKLQDGTPGHNNCSYLEWFSIKLLHNLHLGLSVSNLNIKNLLKYHEKMQHKATTCVVLGT